MPKTTKMFDWEVFDENGDFIDILTMKRSEISAYRKANPKYTIKEIGYSDNDRRDDSWESNSKKTRYLFGVCVPKRQR